jgi:hypothetical protein
MMKECASGFAEHPTGYFIDRGGALGVMIWPVRTVGIPSGRVFPPGANGFLLDNAYGLPNWDPLWILRQGAVVLTRSAKDSSRMHSKKNRRCKMQREVNTEQVRNSEVLHLLPIFTHP